MADDTFTETATTDTYPLAIPPLLSGSVVTFHGFADGDWDRDGFAIDLKALFPDQSPFEKSFTVTLSTTAAFSGFEMEWFLCAERSWDNTWKSGDPDDSFANGNFFGGVFSLGDAWGQPPPGTGPVSDLSMTFTTRSFFFYDLKEETYADLDRPILVFDISSAGVFINNFTSMAPFSYTITVTPLGYVNPNGVTINGTSGNDEIDATHSPAGQPRATSEGDTINGLGGNDKISGLAGDDKIDGGDGDDQMRGGAGDDTMKGGSGNDRFTADDGTDSINGGTGNDTVNSGLGFFMFDGGLGIDTIDYKAWDGDNIAVTLKGATKVFAFFNGAPFDSLRNVESVVTGDGRDKLVGDAAANTFKSNAGKDALTGGRGADDLYAGLDNVRDTFIFAKGDSGKTAATWDQLFQFDRSLNAGDTTSDKIDLRPIDGDPAPGDQGLRFVTAFKQAIGSQPDGQVRLVDAGAHVNVQIDFDGNNTVDMIIQVMNISSLSSRDFFL